MHFGMKSEDPNLVFLIMISFYKDDFPWLYEIGLETYRGLRIAKTSSEKRKYAEAFDSAIQMLGQPMMREMFGKSDEMYMFHKEFRHIIHICRMAHQNVSRVKIEMKGKGVDTFVSVYLD